MFSKKICGFSVNDNCFAVTEADFYNYRISFIMCNCFIFRLILEYLRGAVLKERFSANDLPQPLIKIAQLPELLRLVGINASFK